MTPPIVGRSNNMTEMNPDPPPIAPSRGATMARERNLLNAA
jgi:hypothetical protein